jgi:carbon-monoxide dehydrogenase large subunit
MKDEKSDSATNRYIGDSSIRSEDPRFLRGEGNYVDNIKLPSMAYSGLVRSTHAHARIISIDVEKALELPGVVAILTASSLGSDNALAHPNWLVGNISVPNHYLLARDKVHYVGDAIAFVIAESREVVEDAKALVRVRYEPLAAIIDERTASQMPAIHENVTQNLAGVFNLNKGDYDAAKLEADHTLQFTLKNNRLIPSPIEPRALLASVETSTGKTTLYISTQVPHLHKRWIAETLGWSENKIRIISPDIGGGFGAKMHLYVEDLLVCIAAKKLERPIKWTETRSESHLSTHHGRAHTQEIEVAFNKDGLLLGMSVYIYANLGAYISNMATGIPTVNCLGYASGTYNVPAFKGHVDLLLTNTVPVDAYRGAGRPEAAYIAERAIDRVARYLKLDPLDVRRKNVIRHFPAKIGLGEYDSGSFYEAMDSASNLIDYKNWRHQQSEAKRSGRLIGIGISNYSEVCGVGPSWLMPFVGFDRGGYESAQIKVHPDGKVTFATGSMPQGQGHATSYAQIVATQLCIPFEHVEVEYGDTDLVPIGIGTYNSRSMAVGGSAAYYCAQKIVKKATNIAALLIESEPSDVVYREGVFQSIVPGANKHITFAEVARAASRGHTLPAGEQPGLEETFIYDPTGMSSPNGCHIVVIELEPQTGVVTILEYVAVDDAGTLINPMLAEGQIHGGVAQGIGQAMLEEVVYADDGQLLSSSLQEYALPKSTSIPWIQGSFLSTPTTTNPLGAKGIGEAGAVGAPPAIVNAVCDALSLDHIDMPLTPPRIWQAIQEAAIDGGSL